MNSLSTRLAERTQVLPNGCHQWTGVITSKGYGRVRGVDRKWLKAHRVAYELCVGPIPQGLVIDHLCRNRACVNPQHMEPVSNSENARRGWVARGEYAPDECRQGHPRTEANTYTEGNGKRRCRPCKVERNRAYRRSVSLAVSA